MWPRSWTLKFQFLVLVILDLIPTFDVINPSFTFLFFKKDLFILLRESMRLLECALKCTLKCGEGGVGGGRESPSHLSTECRTWCRTWSQEPEIMSWAEIGVDAQSTEPPRHPLPSLLNTFFSWLPGFCILLIFVPTAYYFLSLFIWFLWFHWLLNDDVSPGSALGPLLWEFIFALWWSHVISWPLCSWFPDLYLHPRLFTWTHIAISLFHISIFCLSKRYLELSASKTDLSSRPVLAPDVPISVNDYFILLFA